MLLTHDCTAKFSSNHIIKIADDTSVVGLISNNDETHYREEVAQLVEWCGANKLSLNVSKTKEVVLDFRQNSGDHLPLTIDSGESTEPNSWGCTSQRTSPEPPTLHHSPRRRNGCNAFWNWITNGSETASERPQLTWIPPLNALWISTRFEYTWWLSELHIWFKWTTIKGLSHALYMDNRYNWGQNYLYFFLHKCSQRGHFSTWKPHFSAITMSSLIISLSTWELSSSALLKLCGYSWQSNWRLIRTFYMQGKLGVIGGQCIISNMSSLYRWLMLDLFDHLKIQEAFQSIASVWGYWCLTENFEVCFFFFYTLKLPLVFWQNPTTGG